MAIYLAYYNKRGEVKTEQMFLDASGNNIQAIPKEDYFFKGLVFRSKYLSAFDIHRITSSVLTADELHFLTCDYGFFPELRKELYRNENVPFLIPYTEEIANAIKFK